MQTQQNMQTESPSMELSNTELTCPLVLHLLQGENSKQMKGWCKQRSGSPVGKRWTIVIQYAAVQQEKQLPGPMDLS